MRSARFVAFCGTTIASAGFVISAFANSVSDFVFVFILLGLAMGCHGTNSFLIIRQYFKRRVGLAVGVFASSVGAGNFAMPQVVKLLLANDELKKNIILIYAGIHSFSFIGVLLMRDFKPSKMELTKESGTIFQNPDVVEKLVVNSGNGQDVAQKPEDVQETGNCLCCAASYCQKFTIFRIFSMINWSLLKRLDFLIIAIGESVSFVCIILYLFQVSHICLEKGLSPGEVADILTICAIMDIISRVGHGAVGDMAFVNNLFNKPKLSYCLIMFILTASTIIGLTLSDTYLTILVFAALVKLWAGGTMVTYSLMYYESFADDLPSCLGIGNLFRALLAFIIGPLFGLVKESTQGSSLELLFLAGLIFLASAVWIIHFCILRKK